MTSIFAEIKNSEFKIGDKSKMKNVRVRKEIEIIIFIYYLFEFN
jgi:hypothetical protein